MIALIVNVLGSSGYDLEIIWKGYVALSALEARQRWLSAVQDLRRRSSIGDTKWHIVCKPIKPKANCPVLGAALPMLSSTMDCRYDTHA